MSLCFFERVMLPTSPASLLRGITESQDWEKDPTSRPDITSSNIVASKNLNALPRFLLNSAKSM